MGESDETLRDLFERYAERYMASDAEAVSQMYAAPFLAVRSGVAIHLPDRAAVREHLDGVMAAYRRSGAARADVEALDLDWQGNRAVAATVRWIVRGASGNTIRDFRTTYELVGPDPWVIVSYVNHDIVDG